MQLTNFFISDVSWVIFLIFSEVNFFIEFQIKIFKLTPYFSFFHIFHFSFKFCSNFSNFHYQQIDLYFTKIKRLYPPQDRLILLSRLSHSLHRTLQNFFLIFNVCLIQHLKEVHLNHEIYLTNFHPIKQHYLLTCYVCVVLHVRLF